MAPISSAVKMHHNGNLLPPAAEILTSARDPLSETYAKLS